MADLITEGTWILVAERGHPLGGQTGKVLDAGAEWLTTRLDGGRVAQVAATACLPVHWCPHCGSTSADSKDIEERYCRACLHFCDDPIGEEP